MFISPTNAVKMYDVSKPTLYKDMSDGKLSFNKDDRNRRKLNVAELDRLYDKREGDSSTLTLAAVNKQSALTEPNVNNQHLIKEINAIREQIESARDREVELLKQQIEQFKNQVENLNRHLDETREEHRMSLRLLEDKREEQGSKTSDWEDKFQEMQHQLNAVEKQNRLLIAREEERKKRIEERRQQKRDEKKLIEAERNRGFFSKLFG